MAPVEAATLVLKAAYLVLHCQWMVGSMRKDGLAYIARTVALRVEPPLNPNQPNQMKMVPR